MPDIIASGPHAAPKRLKDMGDGSYAEVIASASTSNITGKFRESFETYDPVNGGRWVESKASGDLIYVDGNSAAASYLVISKDPLTADTESSIELAASKYFNLPTEVAFGASMSQRTLGQEFSVEAVDVGTPLADVPDIAIASITQTASVLTIDTVAPHGLTVGKSIGVFGCSNLLANYPSLVVASTPSPLQITCTAGPGGTILSQTITNPTGAKGFVYFRQRLGRASNGVSQIFENATPTNASLYVRSESGDALPSGTIAGTHSATIGTTASVQLVNAAYNYAMVPTTEYRLLLQSDRIQWADSGVDATAQMTSRGVRTQVCPDPDNTYKLRLRATNNKALTVPNAQIVSAVKTGATTATIVTDRPHLLAVADPVVIYGIRAQAATEFPNLTTASPVASVIDATTFTIVIGTAGTVTSYGGYVAKVQGGNLMTAMGASVVVALSATLSTLADGTRQLVLVGGTNWNWLIGDLIELVGARADLTGVSLGIDGPWKVANQATTTLTLVLPFTGQRTLPADFGVANCGGSTIRRTDMRVSFVRVFDYERLRFEALARPSSDAAGGMPMTLQNTPAVTLTSTSANQGTAAAIGNAGVGAWPVRGTPHITQDIASAALTTVGPTTSAAVDLSGNTGSMQINVDATASGGTTPRLITRVQGALDASANFVNIFDIGVIANATSKNNDCPVIPVEFRAIRYVRDLQGTTPTVTHSVNRTMRPLEASRRQRRLLDRTIGLFTSTTPSADYLYVGGCSQAQLMCTPVTGLTGTPVLKAQLCQGDPTIAGNWYDVPGAPTLAPSLTLSVATAPFAIGNAKFMRLVASTAGTAATANTYELALTAWE